MVTLFSLSICYCFFVFIAVVFWLLLIFSAFFVKEYFPVLYHWRHPVAINVKTGMPPFGILANHKIKMCHNSMKKIMIQKITQNNWNFWTVNLIMRAKKLLTSRQIFRYAVPARTVTKKPWTDYRPVWFSCTMSFALGKKKHKCSAKLETRRIYGSFF